MDIIPPSMRKGVKCKCGHTVKYIDENGNKYCSICYLDKSYYSEDRKIAGLAKTMKCSEGRARQIVMEARSRI